MKRRKVKLVLVLAVAVLCLLAVVAANPVLYSVDVKTLETAFTSFQRENAEMSLVDHRSGPIDLEMFPLPKRLFYQTTRAIAGLRSRSATTAARSERYVFGGEGSQVVVQSQVIDDRACVLDIYADNRAAALAKRLADDISNKAHSLPIRLSVSGR